VVYGAKVTIKKTAKTSAYRETDGISRGEHLVGCGIAQTTRLGVENPNPRVGGIWSAGNRVRAPPGGLSQSEAVQRRKPYHLSRTPHLAACSFPPARIFFESSRA
jgi:hypothetical protein